MKTSGFTFVRNAIAFDYPVREAILSVLPLCDEFVVSVGNSDDATLALVESIDSPKLRIVHSVWDDTLRNGGRLLAVETEKAYHAVAADADWAFYIQADEVLHERSLDNVRRAMEENKDRPEVDGLLLNYHHFYGSYDYVGEASSWYRREVRVIRKRADIVSYRDAQGFRKLPNRKLDVRLVDAWIHHYGWVRPPKAMGAKQLSNSRLYHDDRWISRHANAYTDFDYGDIDVLSRFTGTHPEIMQERIRQMNWTFDRDMSRNRFGLKDRVTRAIERISGWRPGEYRNYRII